MEPTTFGALLKRYRMAAGLTQEALAERANLSTRAISDLERGLSRAPRYDTLDMLTSAMNLEASQRAALFAAARPALPREVAKAAPLQVLPLPPTTLLGREQEVAQALDLLRERGVRLLTVTGPGGVGKTRLALEIAHDLRASFADGLVWIDLTALRDPSLVPQTVAHMLGLREQADHAFSEQVRAFLQDKQCLLLLDNVEHVLSTADFIADLLTNCPRLQVLVTSRVPLHLRAEQQLVLTPLSQAAAMALFRERAQQVQPGLDNNLPTVAAICDQLDRLPLAIELAAAHVKVLSLPVLLERLSQRLLLLRGGARDLPERQRTMREAIAWSYDLLTATEQHWLRALGVFMGGCQLAAVEAVCQGEEPIASDVGLSTIAALVNASLVQVETTREGLTRYRLLEVIREYALEQLRAGGEENLYQRRHAEYYAALAEEAERVGPGQGSREAHLEQESANGRAALHWAYERGEVALGLRLATWFGLFWMKRGQMSEGSMWLEQMLVLDEALALVRVYEMTWGIANILTLLGHLAREQQDHEQAKGRYRESLTIYQRLGNATYTAWCLEGIAAVACAEESYERATRLAAAAAVLRSAAHTPLPPTEQEDVDKVVMTAHAELDERVFTEQWNIGSTLTQDDAISYALMGLPK